LKFNVPVSSIAKGLIGDDEAASILAPARLDVARIEADLATAQTHTNVVELHPQAVQRFKDNIAALARILSDRDGLPDLEIAGTFRSLVENVVVQPARLARSTWSTSGAIYSQPNGRRTVGFIDGSGRGSRHHIDLSC